MAYHQNRLGVILAVIGGTLRDVHPKIAQSLTRHSDINLTMNRYTHILLETQSDALKALPELNGSVGEVTAQVP